MKQSKYNFAIFAASLCALIVLAVSPVLAAETSDGNTGADPTDGSQAAEDSNSNVGVKDKAAMFRKDGLHRLEMKRSAVAHKKTKAERAKTCENIQKAVNNKLKAFDNHADKYLVRLNGLFTKVQAYQTEHNVALANYDALVATATQKQTDANISVAALKSLGTTLDCSATDPASTLTSVKSGAADARDALKAYRTSLKELVVALVQVAKTDATTTSTEAN